MAIQAGQRLGPFEILSAIGAGGMGEVYRAHDSKLSRDVAIKVLPEAFAHDTERLSRFQREAKVLASLNHPNIATIHGLEQSGGTSYLVMELVPGETLQERVKRDGPVPVEEALDIAKQIAEALEAAHEKGIIHRDLKPANVKVTPEGKVKVLDFGLAKAFASDASAKDSGNSPTLSQAATMQGVILGTAAYMSPEQARGRAVDKRTDIWAFGCVLYELLTGKPAFHGEDVTEILASVVKSEPDWTLLPGNISPSIRVLLQRCLRKDRRQRTPDAGTIRIEIEDAIAAPKDSGATQATRASTSKLLVVIGALAVATTIIAAVALWGWWLATRPVEQALRPLVRLDVDLGPDVSLGSATRGTDVIVSPNGTRMVYVSQGRLFTRRLDQPDATELAGTQGANSPFFSPDGQWVAFFAQSEMKKISVDGGASIVLCAAPYSFGGSWAEDGNIIAGLGLAGGLSRIPSAGGPPTPATDLQSGEVTHRWPQILPGGKTVLFTANTTAVGFEGANIEVMSLANHRTRILVRGGTFGRYLPSGHLIYVNRGTLFAVPFDLDRLEVRGTPSPVLNQVGYSAGGGSAQFDFSQTGTLIYRSGEAGGALLTVQWLDAAGKTQPLLAKPGAYVRPSLSPDGRRLAVSSSPDIWVYEWQRDTMTRLTFGTTPSTYPIWSPDGRYILYEAPGGIFWTRSDGSGKPQPLTQSKNLQFPYSFTGDGKRLAFLELNPETQYDIWTVLVESDGAGLRAGKPEVFVQTPFDERHPTFSPDGRWLAYDSNESGGYQVYVRAFPDKGGKWQISNGGGMYPIWSRNGHELFFRTEDSQIMVTSYSMKDDSFVADKPRVWTEKRIANIGLNATYDLAPDGKRIAALMPVDTPEGQKAQNHVIFLENFFDEVRRRTATQGK
jgi:Tol biopolymer transport system component